MHEDYSYEGDGPMGDGPRLAPIEISDLLGNSISAQILRNMLVTGPNGIWNEFGIDAESAATMLVCCELAELTAWDRDALLQAATLWGWADCPLACGGITAQSAARKIDLELKRGKHPEIFSHAEGIRFLDGLGLKVFPQLIEAVACFQEMTHNEQGEQDTSECKPSPDQAATEPVPIGGERVAQRPEKVDFSLLATPDELIAAFGAFTGMDASWFSKIADKPRLHEARRFAGTRGKGGTKPLFCPLAVMLWLIGPRKVGRTMSASKGWEMLEKHFPRVYSKYSVGDPRESD